MRPRRPFRLSLLLLYLLALAQPALAGGVPAGSTCVPGGCESHRVQVAPATGASAALLGLRQHESGTVLQRARTHQSFEAGVDVAFLRVTLSSHTRGVVSLEAHAAHATACRRIAAGSAATPSRAPPTVQPA